MKLFGYELKLVRPIKTNTAFHAKRELDILVKTVPDAIIRDFIPEIIALCEKFGSSGQSGGSAPYIAGALSSAIKTLCSFEPICGLTNDESEWHSCSGMGDMETFQNNRLSSVFKHNKSARPYYLDAIVFNGQSGSSFTSNGSVKLKDGTILRSRQYIKSFPFKPKTFYVDVIETEWADKTETIEKQGGGWWTSVVKDEEQLKQVFEYYDKYEEN